MAENDKAIAKVGPTSLAERPDYIPKDTSGTEHITKDDLIMPRISIAQGLSPQILEDDPAYIEGLKLGQMFNTITKHIYGRGPLEFCVIRADRPRGVEFIPLKEGGGVKDFDVPLDDPRMQFTDGPEGERLKPVATKFYDFLVVLLPSKEMAALSFKSTGLKVAKELNSLIKLRGTALYTGKYELSSATETNAAGTYGVYRVKNAGWVDNETFQWAKAAFETMKDKEVIIEREQAEEAPSAGEKKDDIPF